ncbi:hypothetical protein SDC9_124676 [bioreactor metagenome]|uniref:Uncharacterized protein n=1 Tax=bioreactor metagenome TaxID=1076179 RepID=A0A645CL89_9ZZZZ
MDAGRGGEAQHHQGKAHRNQGEDRDHLDQGEPELDLAEEPYGEQVERQQHDQSEHGQPDRHRQVADPELPVSGHRDDVGHAGEDPAEPVRPADGEGRPGAEQVGGEVLEGGVLEVVQQQLAHRPHDEEQHHADDHVDQQDRGAGQRDGPPRPHEQAGADRSADRDQLDVAVRQVAAQVVVDRLLGVLVRSAGGRHPVILRAGGDLARRSGLRARLRCRGLVRADGGAGPCPGGRPAGLRGSMTRTRHLVEGSAPDSIAKGTDVV